MTFKKLSAVAIAALTTLALTACGGDTEAAEPDGNFGNAIEIRDALSSTDYECVRWDDYGEDEGRCSFDKYTNTPNHWVKMTDDPEMLAAVKMDNDTESVGSVVGEDWEFECGSGMSAGDCREVASILGGEHIYRGYWG